MIAELYLRMIQTRLEFWYAAVCVGDAGDKPGAVDEDMEPGRETSLVDGLTAPFEVERLGLGALVENEGAGRLGNLVIGYVVSDTVRHGQAGQRPGGLYVEVVCT